MVVCTHEVSKRLAKIGFSTPEIEAGQVWYFDEKETLVVRHLSELIEKDKWQCIETETGKRLIVSEAEFSKAVFAPSFEALFGFIMSEPNIADILAYGLIENKKIESGY